MALNWYYSISPSGGMYMDVSFNSLNTVLTSSTTAHKLIFTKNLLMKGGVFSSNLSHCIRCGEV